MEPIVYSLPLDAGQTGAQALLHVRQGDARSRCFRFRLTQGGTAYPVADAVSAVLRGSKPDGTILYEDCEIRDGIICYTLTEALTAAQGTVECELTLYGANATVLSSPKFEIYVDGSAYPDGYVSSTSAFTALQGAMTDVQGLFTEAEGLIEDLEAAIAAGETGQDKAEEAERTAKGHAEQTGEDRIATGEDRVATGADRSAVNTALTGFAETTLPNAIQAVEDKADTEIARVGQAGDMQVQVVNAAGAEQIGLATAQADRAEGEADRSKTEADKSEQSATIAANNILNGVDTHNASPAAHDDIREAVQQAENIARGRATAYVFDTYQDMVEWLGDPEHTGGLVRGDNLYIRDTGVKDYWWDGDTPQELEAEAPDLTDYYTKTQVDALLPIYLSESEYAALVAAGTVQAGRVYYPVPDDLWEGL